jgi:hypothetical protein
MPLSRENRVRFGGKMHFSPYSLRIFVYLCEKSSRFTFLKGPIYIFSPSFPCQYISKESMTGGIYFPKKRAGMRQGDGGRE